MWALTDSEAIQAIIKEKYKQQRHSDDENQPLSVQPWGFDGDKRRYFLVQGLDDTSFRVYREGDRYKKTAHWWSVAGSIDEVKELAKKLEEVDATQAARRFAGRITNAIPTFEATEEVRPTPERATVFENLLTVSPRNAVVANIAKSAVLPSLDLNPASHSTKAVRVASVCGTSTMKTILSFQMILLHGARQDSLADRHPSRPCPLLPRAGANRGNRGPASMARAC